MGKADSAGIGGSWKLRGGNSQNQREMPEIESIVPEMKRAFDGLVSAQERGQELEGVSVKTSRSQEQREKRIKIQSGLSKSCGHITGGVTCTQGDSQRRRKEETGETCDVRTAENLPKLVTRTTPEAEGAWRTPGRIHPQNLRIELVEND